MKCKECGKEILEESEFCAYCGNKIVNNNIGNKKITRNIICVASGFVGIIIIIAIVMYSMNSNSTTVVSDSDFYNVNNEDLINDVDDQEVLDYISKEINKIFKDTKNSIFLTGTSDDTDMIAINGLKLGNVQSTSDSRLIHTYLNGDIENMGIFLTLENDKISNIQVNIVYSGQYYITFYATGGSSYYDANDLSKYIGQITYNVDITNYSNVTFRSDVRYDATYGSVQYFTGDDSECDLSGGYFKASLLNGAFTDIEFFRRNREIDINNLNFDYQLENESELESDNIGENQEVVSQSETTKELTQEEKKNKAKEALETIHTEIYAGEGADISETYLSPISYGITAYYTIYDNEDINYRIEKVVVVNQQTGISAEVIHNNEYNSIGSAKVDLVDGTNTIIFTFYDNYGNTKQESKTVNKLNF